MCFEITSSGVSAFASLLTAVFTIGVLFQVRQLKIQNENNSVNQLYLRMSEIQKMMINDVKFQNALNGSPSSPLDKIFLEIYADFLEQIALQLRYLPKKVQKAWRNYIFKSLKNHPALPPYINDEKNLYSKALRKYL